MQYKSTSKQFNTHPFQTKFKFNLKKQKWFKQKNNNKQKKQSPEIV